MPKHPGGRPPETLESIVESGKFPENWKDIVLQMSADGKSEVEIQAEILLIGGRTAKSINTLWYALKEREEEFKDTIKIGRILCQAWWERISRENLLHHKDLSFETGSWFANMKNRFGWKDKTDIEMEMYEYKHEEFRGKTPDEIRKMAHDLAVDITRERVTSSQN